MTLPRFYEYNFSIEIVYITEELFSQGTVWYRYDTQKRRICEVMEVGFAFGVFDLLDVAE
jgi:hypothetical protein